MTSATRQDALLDAVLPDGTDISEPPDGTSATRVIGIVVVLVLIVPTILFITRLDPSHWLMYPIRYELLALVLFGPMVWMLKSKAKALQAHLAAKVYPELAARLAPLKPTQEELQALFRELARARVALGRRVDVDALMRAIQSIKPAGTPSIKPTRSAETPATTAKEPEPILLGGDDVDLSADEHALVVRPRGGGEVRLPWASFTRIKLFIWPERAPKTIYITFFVDMSAEHYGVGEGFVTPAQAQAMLPYLRALAGADAVQLTAFEQALPAGIKGEFLCLHKPHGSGLHAASGLAVSPPDEHTHAAPPAAEDAKAAPPPAHDNLDATAQAFLQALASNGTVEGGLAFAKALQQVQLDYSEASLDRVDRLLDQMADRLAPQREAFTADTDKRHFLWMLAFYLGEYIARQTGRTMHWYTYDQVQRHVPADFGLPRAFFSSLVGMVEGQVFLPLGFLGDRLFDKQRDMRCQGYVQRLLDKLTTQEARDENGWRALYLERFSSGGKVPGGLPYRAELDAANLDYSLASLDRLDAFLVRLRRDNALGYSEFVQGETGNLALLLGYYLGTTIAQAGQFSMKWLTYAEYHATLPEPIDERFETGRCCILEGRYYFPLGVVTEILFDPAPSRTCAGYAQQIIGSIEQRLVSIRLSNIAGLAVGEPDSLAPDARAFYNAGFLAALQMFMLADGGDARPTILRPERDGKTKMISLMDESLQGAIEMGNARMRDNPDRSAHLVFATDAMANLPSGRIDALHLQLRLYVGKRGEANIVVPYRPAGHPAGFALYSPKYVGDDFPKARQPELFAAFYAGVGSFKSDTFDWQRHLDESI